ncbi:MAG: SRPBCC domain-containing protein [Acidimicrobiia bacterium]|nr:SRPBCC domain-containing protein [Acidimicrobiia bacterium]
MTDDRRIELEIEVPGTPEEVWRAIATGPGISSWYVPHVVEEREGGAASASFGPGPEMQIQGRVAAWEPPHRIVFDGGEGVGGFAFEWLVEARGQGSCVVRLINSGFGTGDEWDDQYDAMTEGWKLFLLNLRLHLEHFKGQTAAASLPMTMWSDGPEGAWATLVAALGLPDHPAEGDHVAVTAADAPPLAGTVVRSEPGKLALLVDTPAPGTAFVAAERHGPVSCGVSVWMYLYGPEGAAAAERDEPRWRSWLDAHAEPVG